MQKFGLFDIIEKLAPYEKTIKSLFNQKTQADKKPTTCTPLPTENDSKKYGYASLCQLLKRHDEISKRIDKNNKK